MAGVLRPHSPLAQGPILGSGLVPLEGSLLGSLGRSLPPAPGKG